MVITISTLVIFGSDSYSFFLICLFASLTAADAEFAATVTDFIELFHFVHSTLYIFIIVVLGKIAILGKPNMPL